MARVMSMLIATGMLLVLGFSNTQSRETIFFFFEGKNKVFILIFLTSFKSLFKIRIGCRYIKQDAEFTQR